MSLSSVTSKVWMFGSTRHWMLSWPKVDTRQRVPCTLWRFLLPPDAYLRSFYKDKTKVLAPHQAASFKGIGL